MSSTSFPPNSRYYGIPTDTMKGPGGEPVVYLQRRFVPPPERFQLLQEHRVTQGDRLDNIAAQYFGDPEQYWKICDANGAINPDDLTETPGTVIRITMPEGIPGPSNA